jgi:MYXO-CTERM domain-containing protein
MKLTLAFAAAMLMTATMMPAPAAACRHTCGSTGGTPVPAPGVAALFALGFAGLVARSRKQRG